jgi:hypothetical protein
MEKSEKILSPLKKTGKMLEQNLYDDIGGERLFGKKETFSGNNKVSKVKQNGDEMLRTKRDSKEKKTKETLSNGLEMDLDKREKKKGKDQRKKESDQTMDRKMKESDQTMDRKMKESYQTMDRKKKESDQTMDRKKKEKKKKKESELDDDEGLVLKKDKKKKVTEDFDGENFGKKSNGKKGNEKLLGKIATNKNVAQSDFAQMDDNGQFSRVQKSISNGDASLPNKTIDEDELTFDLRVADEGSSLNVESKNHKNLSESLPQNDSLFQTEENKSKMKKNVSEDSFEDKPQQQRKSRSRVSSDRSKKMSNGISKGGSVSRSLSPSKENVSRSHSPSKDKQKKKKEDSLGDEFDSSSWRTKKIEKEKRKESNEVERKEKEAVKEEKEKNELFGADYSMLMFEKEATLDAEDDDVFVVDSLPRFAKSYILPRVMNKESVEARMRKDETSADPLVRMSTSKENEDEDQKNEAFKFSMLKASLDYESGFVGSAPVPPPKPKMKTRTKKLSTGSCGDRSDDVSGRTSSLSHANSNAMSNKKSRKMTSGNQNCIGPGSIGDYVSYVKSGGFVPLPVLEPERGVEASLFAQYPGLDALDEDGLFSSGKVANWRQKPNTIEEVHVTIDDQFEKIRQKYGEPTIVIKTEEEEERERQKMLQKLNSKKPPAKKRAGDDLLDLNIPAPTFESGYSTWIEGSSVDTVSEASLKNVLSLDQAEHFFSGENSLLPTSSTTDVKTTKILRDAMSGQNLLGMMEEPKAKFNQNRDFSGSDSLDLFIDPIAIFGSDRHPALQEVLQQLDMCKRHRGDLQSHRSIQKRMRYCQTVSFKRFFLQSLLF